MPDEKEIGLERDTAEIVAAYLRHNQMPTDQVGLLITTVYGALKNMGSPPEVEERTPAVSIRGSVQRDYVVCLECGKKGSTMRRHLMVRHGLSPTDYRARWNLRAEHPLTAPGYSERRSDLAKQLGLGRRRQEPESAEVKRRKAPKTRSARPRQQRRSEATSPA
jgi:predicted transcriptional regulator